MFMNVDPSRGQPHRIFTSSPGLADTSPTIMSTGISITFMNHFPVNSSMNHHQEI